MGRGSLVIELLDTTAAAPASLLTRISIVGVVLHWCGFCNLICNLFFVGCPTTPVKGAEGGGGEAGGSGRRAGRPSGADDDNIEVLDTEHEMVRKRNASSGAY